MRFLAVFIPMALLATGTLWMTFHRMNLQQEGFTDLVEIFRIIPFIAGPALAAGLTYSLLRLLRRVYDETEMKNGCS